MNLKALQQGDQDEWDRAFRWVWPAAFGAAQAVLQAHLANEAEDVAIEAEEVLVEKVRNVASAEELKPLVASIAHNLAVSRLRRHFADRRGAGQTESLETRRAENGDLPDAIAPDSPVAALEEKELFERLRRLLAALKPPCRGLLADLFMEHMSYEELATKFRMPVSTVGVYLLRCRKVFRRAWEGEPE